MNKKRLILLSLGIIIALTSIIGFISIIIPFYIRNEFKENIYKYPYIDDLPKREVAIVFGTGAASDILKDRVTVASDLYKLQKVKKIIMSGYKDSDYNEPETMMLYAKASGVPENALFADFAGLRTYDTCYRAKHLFGLEEAILITQHFHLPRAIYLCESFGIKSTGVTSDLHTYEHQNSLRLREFFAIDLAVIDVYLRKPPVILGEKIEI